MRPALRGDELLHGSRPAEAEQIRREIAEARRALDVLEASIGDGGVLPCPVSRR